MKNQNTYWIWSSMIQRCTNPKNKHYKNYGARKIYVSDSWLKFSNFISDMGNRPEDFTLERIDNSKGYCKENCKWASRLENNNNKRIYKTNITKVSGLEIRKDTGTFRARIRYKKEIVLDKTTNDFFEACCFIFSKRNEVKQFLQEVDTKYKQLKEKLNGQTV